MCLVKPWLLWLPRVEPCQWIKGKPESQNASSPLVPQGLQYGGRVNKRSSDNKAGLVIRIKDTAVDWTDKLQSNMSRKQWANCAAGPSDFCGWKTQRRQSLHLLKGCDGKQWAANPIYCCKNIRLTAAKMARKSSQMEGIHKIQQGREVGV